MAPAVNTKGTAGNDLYKGIIDVSTPANATLQAIDDIDGGAGTDTLQIIANGAAANSVTPLFLKNVEKVSVKDVDAAAGTTVNLVNATGVTEVINDGSVGAVVFQNIGAAAVTVQDGKTAAATTTFLRGTSPVTADLTINLSNLGTVDVPGTTGVLAGAVASNDVNNAATSVTINATGTVRIASMNVTGDAGSATHKAQTLTINAAGSTNFGAGITGFDTTKADKIVVTGAGSVTLGTLAGAVQTVDASANTGGVTLTGTVYGGSDATAAAAPGLKITGGSGKDSITVTGVASAVVAAGAGDDTVNVSAGLVAGAKIDGGDGTDRIVVSAAQANLLDNQNAAGTALRATLTGFEQLSVNTILGAADNFNINQAGGYNYLVVGGDVTGVATTVSGFTSGATVEFTRAGVQTAALEIGVTDAALTSTDVLNLKLNANLAGSIGSEATYLAGITGINTVNVVANDARDNVVDNNNSAATADNGPDDGYTLALSNAANLTNLNISGSSLVSYTLTAGTNALKTVDASASTGNAVIDVTAFAGTERVTVNGSQGQNTLTGSNTAFGDALNGGAKNDSLTGNQGADALKGNGGRDLFNFVNGDSLAVTGQFDKVADFGKVTVAGVANTTVTFQNVGAVGGADADLLNVADAGLALAAAKAITAFDAAALGRVGGVTGSDVIVTDDIKIAVNAKGVVTLSGANAAKVDTLAEWVAVAQEAAGTVAGATTAFEFNGNTYVFQEVTASTATAGDTLVELTGVTGFGATNGLVLAGSNAAVGDIFVG